MSTNFLILFFGVVCVSFQVTGLSVKDRKHCCDLGTNFATSGNDCKNFKPEWAGPGLRTEKSCLSTVDLCCNKQIRQRDCQLGTTDAVNGVSCSYTEGDRKDCCEACQAGIEAARSKERCGGLGLGDPYDEAFNKCCEDYAKVKSTTITTTTTTTTLKTLVDRSLELDNEPLENICDSDVCAQICEIVDNSYKCDCYKGYVLMEDRLSCRPEKRVLKKGGRCEINNPCDHDCIDTGTAIKCSCREGFQLAQDSRTCQDIDECTLNLHDCTETETCINEVGTYVCYDSPEFENDTIDYENKCPTGYKFNFEKGVCDDIDECQFSLICVSPQVCKNTIGSFICEDNSPRCPPGFHYKAAILDCADIDECITGEHDCNKESQICLNTKGNYTCVDKASKHTCPPGFKKNAVTQFCEDINECEEEENLCAQNEVCVNELGGHTCEPKNVTDLVQTPKSVTRSTTTSTTTTARSTTTKVVCPKGYSFVEDTGVCSDINECQVGQHGCTIAERCDNTIGSYHCTRIFGCGTGYTFNSANGLCEDDDECYLGTHNCKELGPNFKCRNTMGSYRCEPTRPAYNAPPVTEREPGPSRNYHENNESIPVEEPPFISSKYYTVQTTPTVSTTTTTTERQPFVNHQDPGIVSGTILPIGNPALSGANVSGTILPIGKITTEMTTTQKPVRYNPTPNVPSIPTIKIVTPEGTLPYYSPRSTTPSTTESTDVGYPYWSLSGQSRNPYYRVINGQLKKCLPGYRMNNHGQCEDIDECQSNPCSRFEKCVNYKGRFECIPPIQCKIGYELSESGDQCVDVNECSRGIHKCSSTQICKNYNGYYTCECPPGHHLDKLTNQCEDIDECRIYRPCRTSSSNCVNLQGSFRCDCKPGFQRRSVSECSDIDECAQTGLCEHNCVNIWGSYRCSCNQGFTLNRDNRTCTDIDECERFKDKRLCIGTCKNVPGSYRCECPPGYKLGNDGRVCVDIDECQQNVCLSDEVCLNTRGGYKCYRINCPPNYVKDTEHRSRCKRLPSFCDPRDYQCLLLPEQYTYQYITLVSNLPLTRGQINLFRINGPEWHSSRAEFTLKLLDVVCPYGIEKVNENYFRKSNIQFNSMALDLVKPIQGPQEIKLQIEMHLYQSNVIIGNAVVYIIIVVSEFPF